MQPYGAKFVRATVDRNIRVVLPSVPDHWRLVQVLVPTDVQAFMDTFDLKAGKTIGKGKSKKVIDHEDLVPRYYGHNRSYKLPTFFAISNRFHLEPGQCLVAAAETAFETMTLIVEWAPTPEGA